MILQYPDFLRRLVPSYQEAVFAILFVGFASTITFAYLDVIIHDNYILLFIAGCYPENEEPLCIEARNVNGCPPNTQACIGLNYWILLPHLVLLLAVGLAIARGFFGLIGGASVNGMLFLVMGAWFVTALILPYTGWGDYIYFVIKGEPIPETLPWLNNVGLLAYIHIGNDKTVVQDVDLYAVMGIGLIGLIGMWAGLTHLHNKDILEFMK